MKFIQQETSHKLPAVVVCNIPEDSDDAQTVIFLRDDARAEAAAQLRLGQGLTREGALIKLSGMAAA